MGITGTNGDKALCGGEIDWTGYRNLQIGFDLFFGKGQEKFRVRESLSGLVTGQ